MNRLARRVARILLLLAVAVAPTVAEAQYLNCQAGCMECHFNWFLGRFCLEVDNAPGRCDCTDYLFPDGSDGCWTSGGYCYGIILDVLRTPESSPDAIELGAPIEDLEDVDAVDVANAVVSGG